MCEGRVCEGKVCERRVCEEVCGGKLTCTRQMGGHRCSTTPIFITGKI